ncbi:MAG: hypothetical protein HQK78_12320 [Desulfobacterales bacterium]|nr:hypothetical protein [Desulfobacterales bacterium]
MINCKNCGKKFHKNLGFCPFCKVIYEDEDIYKITNISKLEKPLEKGISEYHKVFYPELWFICGTFVIAIYMLVCGFYGISEFEGQYQLLSFFAGCIGIYLFLALQLKVTITCEKIRIQHFLFFRKYNIKEIEYIYLIKSMPKYRKWMESSAIGLKMKDGREVVLRPSQVHIKSLFDAIEHNRQKYF